MKSNDLLVSHVHTSWNLCVLLLYAKLVRPKKLIIILERKLAITKFIRNDIPDFKIQIYYSISHVQKLRVIWRIRNLIYDKGGVEFVKFTNFNHFGQMIQFLSKFTKVVFLDDGTTFINILDDSIVYTRGARKVLKELLWPPGFRPKFGCFYGVSVAYLSHKSLIDDHLVDKQVVFEDFGQIFSYFELRKVANKYLLVDREIKKWVELIAKYDTLILGTSFVKHGFMTETEYFDILREIEVPFPTKTLYKPHPHEEDFRLSDRGMNWVVEPLFNLPLEIFLSYAVPKRMISFGSTSSFLLIDSKSDVKCEVILISKLASKKIVDSLSTLKNELVDIRISHLS